MKIALAAIVKDEASSLLEWIAYHKSVGIEHCIILDNGSRDESWPLLCQLRRRGEVICHRFRTLAGQPPQIDAYQYILNRYRHKFDLIIFLDADEYLVPTDGSESVVPAITALFSKDSVSSVVLNWACFGSGGQVFRAEGLVPERFTYRADDVNRLNRHYKSIVRPERVVRFYNPHNAWIDAGQTLDSSGRTLIVDKDNPFGLSQSLCWNRLRVNHYVVKSLEEFLTRKTRAGNATWPDRVKHRRFFDLHDVNEVQDESILSLMPAVHREIDRLTALLSRKLLIERLSDLVSRRRLCWKLEYAWFLIRRTSLYAITRYKHGSLSLKDRE